MCGIVGMIETGQAVDLPLLKRMTERLVHRGPDDEGYYVDETKTVGLGFSRLSIIDLETGNQPMTNESRTIWLVFNGEIYNYRQLRADLEARGHRFATRSDSECIIHGYETHGPEVFRKLNGMFALALWDEGERKLLLARDRAGEKPLHYFFDGRSFLFASEIKALRLHPRVKAALAVDRQALGEFFSYGYIAAPLTIYDNIKKVLPAEYLEISLEEMSLRSRRYWQLGSAARFSGDYEEAASEVGRLFGEAVKMRMESDVPYGAFLSGGIDSSAVTAVMSRHTSRPVRTFSIGFPEADFDERRYARQVAGLYGTHHTEFEVTTREFEQVTRVLADLDEPFGDSSILPTFFLARLTRRHVTVALSGDGGDELFGGYRHYLYLLSQRRKVDRFPAPMRTLVRRVYGPVSRLFSLDGYLGRRLAILADDQASRFIRQVTIFPRLAMKEVLQPRLFTAVAPFENRLWALKGDYFRNDLDFEQQMRRADFHHYLPDDILVKVDRATMMSSLESRAPFLDHRLVELAFSLPDEWLMGADYSKKIFKYAFRDRLPAEILNRDKMGFGVPLRHWLMDRLMPICREALLEADLDYFFRRSEVERLLRRHQQKKRDHTSRIWLLLAFAAWLRQAGNRSLF